MKKIICVIILSLIITTIVQGCYRKPETGNLEIYLAQVDESNDKNLIINEEPLFTDKDIKQYIWETHQIIFTDEFVKKLDFNRNSKDKSDNPLIPKGVIPKGGSVLLGTTQSDRFVMIINNERIYEGYFKQSIVSSFFPPGAVITDYKDGIMIGFNDFVDDMRSDERIYNLLKDKNLIVE